MAQLLAADGTRQEIKFSKDDKLDMAEHLAELLWKRGRFIFYMIGLLAVIVSWFAVTYFAVNAKNDMQREVVSFTKEINESREKIKVLCTQAEADIGEARRMLNVASRELEVKSKEIGDVSKQFKELPMMQQLPQLPQRKVR